MKILQLFSFLAYLLLNTVTVSAEAERRTVEEIVKNPGRFSASFVETEGFIIHYVPEAQNTTSYYLLKGYYGDTLKVNTAEEKPEINQKYKVLGILYMERAYKNGKVSYTAFLSEKSKECLNCQVVGATPVIMKEEGLSELAYVIGGAAGLLIIGLFAYVIVKNKKSPQLHDWDNPTITTDYSQIPKTMEIHNAAQSTHPDSDFKTIKINTAPSKTMRLIPGKLEIIRGEDKGKTFLIQGYPTKEGSILSIGREEVTGERSHCHIQIDSRYKTVSRKQAEIIYKDRKLFIRNLSETNITEVNGQELSLGDTVELQPDCTIGMGEIEFQYKL